jgi:hypothetical protein
MHCNILRVYLDVIMNMSVLLLFKMRRLMKI